MEERAAKLESNMAEQARRVDDVRDALKHLEVRIDNRFDGLEGRFVAIDSRFVAIDSRFVAVDSRFSAMELRLTGMDQKLDAHFIAIDTKMSRIQSLQVGTVLAVIAALAGMLSGLAR